MTTFGIIGAGNIGSRLAKALTGAGYDVVIANSRGPETLAGLVAELGPRARAATVAEAAETADIAVVTIPLGAIDTLPSAPFAGKVVLDTNNYYWERDGHIPELDRGETTTSGMLQEQLPGALVAKAFNSILAPEILTTGSPAGTPGRRALGTASDSAEAIETVTRIYDELGFDTVVVGSLSESWRLERDRPGYGQRQTAEELQANAARAERVRADDAAAS